MTFLSSLDNYFKMHALFFWKSVDKFDVAHKHANFKLGVQYPLKCVLTLLHWSGQ